MKNIFLVILSLIWSNPSFCQIDQAEIIYKAKVYPKIDSTKTPSKKTKKMLELIFKEIKNIDIELIYSEGNSVFKMIESLDNDGDKNYFKNMAQVLVGLSSKYFSNVNNRSIVRTNEFDGITYKITSSFINNWTLVNEQKLINNYNCYKATTIFMEKDRHGNVNKIPVTAWYAPQIPLPLGPKNYVGLPGLILELNEGQNRISFYTTAINLNPKKKLKISKLPRGKVVTEEKFIELTDGAVGKWIKSKSDN